MISVLITTYNKADFLKLTLAGYSKQSFKDFEMVIIDDGSTDNTEEIVDKYRELLNIKYVKQENMGIAKAKMKALENASNDYVILTDDDRIPCITFVEEHKRRLDKEKQCVVMILSRFSTKTKFSFNDEFCIYKRFPELLVCEEKQLFDEKDILKDYDGIVRKYFVSECNTGLLLDIVEEYGEDFDNFELAWSKAYGGNISFSRKYLKRDLQFDCNYVGYGIEDIDFAYQLYLQGYKFRFDSLAVNYHQEHPRRNFENRDMFRNFAYFCKKYPGIDSQMLKLDWFGEASLKEVNSFCRILKNAKGDLKEEIVKYLIG